MALYADIILPLPLEGLFTYRIPSSLENDAMVGKRAIVPLGSSKTYVGVISKIHSVKPNFTVKPITSILDALPIIKAKDFKLWYWIAEYYMSPIGEVMSSALPLGLKSLGKYKPKTRTYIALRKEFCSFSALKKAKETLLRTQTQKNSFESFLKLSHWDTLNGDTKKKDIIEVSKQEFLSFANCSEAVFKGLCDKGLFKIYEREVSSLGSLKRLDFDKIRPLSSLQTKAYEEILDGFNKKDVMLLHGVTSSGKTEIYIHLIRQALLKKKQVLYLLPEIALTVQIRQRLEEVFGEALGIYHSKCTETEKVEIWKKQLSKNPYKVILGARSALFVPFSTLGLVIVDEEHDTSFKQQDPMPRYNGRDTSIMLASMHKAKTLLGSATPSMESYYNALKGKYGYVFLKMRYGEIPLPKILTVDTKDLRHRLIMRGPLSPMLISALEDALSLGEQAILFQNRRGYSSIIECKDCGWVPRCDSCDVALTHHKRYNHLSCHYCGKTYKVPLVCPKCGSKNLQGYGYGTEKIEDKIMELFPKARVARMDLDTMKTRNHYEEIINDFSSKKIDILIGTQMLCKGLDFDNVSVVGILDADSMLNISDFRAYEHAFNMIAQVSGRSGRKDKRGLVVLQTKNPELPIIHQVVNNDYKGFYEDLLQERRLFCYPPVCRIVNVYLKHRDNSVVEKAAQEMGQILISWFSSRVLGPDKPPRAKVRSLNIRKIVIKLESGLDLAKARAYLRQAAEKIKKLPSYGALIIYFDVDPQ